MKQETRAMLIAKFIQQFLVVHPDRVGCTAYEIAHWLGCVPQTVHNTLNKHGLRFGIKCYEVEHRPNINKKIWIVDTDSKVYEFQKHRIEKTYRAYIQEQVKKWTQ